MEELMKGHVSLRQFLVTIILAAAIAAYCVIQHYPYIIPLVLLIFTLHLFFINRFSRKIFLDLGLMVTILLAMQHMVVQVGGWSPYYIPVAVIGMLTMILFNDLHLMFLMALLSSLLVTLICGGDVGMALTFFLGSLMGAYSVRNARRIWTVINAGLVVMLVQTLCMIILNGHLAWTNIRAFSSLYIQPFIVNGFVAASLCMILIKVFERLFDVVTNFTLLELSDFNQPLLKRMILEAPGTYHHSLIVGNLSEAASDAIGADALLTRVGAYYHDIGKMDKSEYFTENQLGGGNKHDDLEASVSKLVIINHVKNGIELAKRHKLNRRIIDFIPQHHGTSLMYFFYQKALKDTEDPATVDESNYRYPGPKPQSKETAIVLLADSVEAATRTLEEPNPRKIEELVRKIINNKFIDGQLDECNLTLKEIDQISATFTKVLSAMYHTRVKYPEKNPPGRKD